jgi:hypothetical protein
VNHPEESMRQDEGVFVYVFWGVDWTGCELLDYSVSGDQEVVMAWFEVLCGVFREVRENVI